MTGIIDQNQFGTAVCKDELIACRRIGRIKRDISRTDGGNPENGGNGRATAFNMQCNQITRFDPCGLQAMGNGARIGMQFPKGPCAVGIADGRGIGGDGCLSGEFRKYPGMRIRIKAGVGFWSLFPDFDIGFLIIWQKIKGRNRGRACGGVRRNQLFQGFREDVTKFDHAVAIEHIGIIVKRDDHSFRQVADKYCQIVFALLPSKADGAHGFGLIIRSVIALRIVHIRQGYFRQQGAFGLGRWRKIIQQQIKEIGPMAQGIDMMVLHLVQKGCESFIIGNLHAERKKRNHHARHIAETSTITLIDRDADHQIVGCGDPAKHGKPCRHHQREHGDALVGCEFARRFQHR